MGRARDDRRTPGRPPALGGREGAVHSPADAVPFRRRQRNRRCRPAPRHAGVLRRERRTLLKAREDTLRDLGGLLVEMYRRGGFPRRPSAGARSDHRRHRRPARRDRGAPARRAPCPRCECGTPILRGSRFCPNCGRGSERRGRSKQTVIEPAPSRDGDHADERKLAIAAADGTCPRCGAARAPDQRYCLECGERSRSCRPAASMRRALDRAASAGIRATGCGSRSLTLSSRQRARPSRSRPRASRRQRGAFDASRARSSSRAGSQVPTETPTAKATPRSSRPPRSRGDPRHAGRPERPLCLAAERDWLDDRPRLLPEDVGHPQALATATRRRKRA